MKTLTGYCFTIKLRARIVVGAARYDLATELAYYQ